MCNGVNAAGGAGAAGNAGNAGNSRPAAASVQADSEMPPAVLELSRFLANSNVRLQ